MHAAKVSILFILHKGIIIHVREILAPDLLDEIQNYEDDSDNHEKQRPPLMNER